MPVFPAGPDNITETITPGTPQSGVHSALHNQVADAVNAIQESLLSGGDFSLTDHGAAADPHPQYLTAVEADALFLTPAEGNILYAPIAGGGYLTQVTANTLYEPLDSAYTKAEADGRYATPASVTSAVSTHEGLANPHAIYLTQAEADALYSIGAHHHSALYEPLDSAYTKAEGDARYALTARGLPTGGDTGQVLSKSSATNYDVGWTTPGTGGGGLTLPLGQHLTFTPDNTYDIGASGANRPRNLYLAGTATVNWLNTTVGVFAGGGSLGLGSNAFSAGSWWKIDSAGVLFPNTDNVSDIGQTATTFRPRNLYLAGTATVGDGTPALPSITFAGDPDTGFSHPYPNQIYVSTGGVARWAFRDDGTLYAGDDNVYDIGLAGGYRPRNLHLAGTATVGDGSQGAPSISFGSDTNTGIYRPAPDWLAFTTAGAVRWYINEFGNLHALPDATHDIGFEGAERPRNLYLAGTASIAGVPAFAAGDKYLTIDASGNIHRSAIGPAS